MVEVLAAGGYCGAVLTCNHLEKLAELGESLHLAIGVFDGVHIGHQAVIERAIRAAKAQGGLAGLLTFDPHPIRVIAPGKAPAALLATIDHKARIACDLGLDLFIALHFDEAFAKMEASEFIERLTVAPVRTIAVGEDWRFGHHRSGDVAFLREEAGTRGFHLDAVAPVMFEGDRVSSTRIRQAIRDGNLVATSAMLGRSYSVSGQVIQGDQLGRTLGFPTANVAIGDVQLPPDGVWVVRVSGGDGIWNAVANLGMRPTVGGTKRHLEAHLLDFSGDLYGSELEIQFVKFLRGEVKFPSVESLRLEIEKDVLAAREVFSDLGKIRNLA